MAEEVCLLDGPFAFAWIDDETIFLEARKDHVEGLDVARPFCAEASDVIKVYFELFDVLEDLFHDGLCNVGRLLDSHGEAIVFVFAERCNDGTKILRFVVEFEGVVAHADVEFCEKLVAGSASQNFSDVW